MKATSDHNKEQQEPIQRVQQEMSSAGTAVIADHRPATVTQRKLKSAMNHASKDKLPIQRKNNTGLPGKLKSGIENLSGYSMDDVKVHYNSSKPAQLQAHAYAQGTNIHLAPGQEKHLPHEAWHVVQQKQGRVKPTRQLKSKVNINDDSRLEKEADVMGAKAMNSSNHSGNNFKAHALGATNSKGVVQRVTKLILGEDHDAPLGHLQAMNPITHQNTWSEVAQVSKIAAALIANNGYVPLAPGTYINAFLAALNGGALQPLMAAAEVIFAGRDIRWGSEDNLTGWGNSAFAQAMGFQPPVVVNNRTHIENPIVRTCSLIVRELATLQNGLITLNSILAIHNNPPIPLPVQTVEDIIDNIDFAIMNRIARLTAVLPGLLPFSNVFATWQQLTAGLGNWVIPPPLPPGAGNVLWANAILNLFNTGLQNLFNAAMLDMPNFLTPASLQHVGINNQLTVAISNAKYGPNANIGARRHAAVSMTRTLTQIEGMNRYNNDYVNVHGGLNIHTVGYIVGDSHVTDILQLLQHQPHSPLAINSLPNLLVVQKADYQNLTAFITGLINNPLGILNNGGIGANLILVGLP